MSVRNLIYISPLVNSYRPVHICPFGRPIYTPYVYMNNLYLIFIDSSATAYGRDIIHIYLLYTIPCCYRNYFIL